MNAGRSWSHLIAVGTLTWTVFAAEPVRGHVTLDEPNGGEMLAASDVFTIVWHVAIPHNTLNWDLWYSTTGPDGPWVSIAADLPAGDISAGAVHTFDWTVPAIGSTLVRVRVDQDNSGTDYSDISDANLTISVPPPPVTIVSANPPTDDPWTTGMQAFRDVLDTGSSVELVSGIGGTGTATQGVIAYSPISVTFSGAPLPPPSPATVIVTCTGDPLDCPQVTSVSGLGGGPWLIALDKPIPPGECTNLTFAGAALGQALQYRSLAGDVTLNGITNTQDLLGLVAAINNGSANDPANLARYNLNRSVGAGAQVNTQDLLRLIQLLNGVNTTQSFNGVSVADCP